MSSLRDTYDHIQARKDEPWEPPAEIVESVIATFRAQQGRDITAAELVVTLVGMGWVTRMALEQDLDMEELMDIVDDLERVTRSSTTRLPQIHERDQIAVGLGSGFFTGLWLGLTLNGGVLKGSDR